MEVNEDLCRQCRFKRSDVLSEATVKSATALPLSEATFKALRRKATVKSATALPLSEATVKSATYA